MENKENELLKEVKKIEKEVAELKNRLEGATENDELLSKALNKLNEKRITYMTEFQDASDAILREAVLFLMSDICETLGIEKMSFEKVENEDGSTTINGEFVNNGTASVNGNIIDIDKPHTIQTSLTIEDESDLMDLLDDCECENEEECDCDCDCDYDCKCDCKYNSETKEIAKSLEHITDGVGYILGGVEFLRNYLLGDDNNESRKGKHSK